MLGQGGMGVVYKARHLKLNRLVALKMIRGRAVPEILARFLAEAQAVARVQHPNVVQVYETSEHEGLPYIALEFVEGSSMDKRLLGQPQPSRKAARIVLSLAEAVEAAHRKGIVHRDLKPANVLVTADGDLKVTDFGLAKYLDQEDGQTRTGAIMGTPSYMAPEQAEGKGKEVGPAADVYALGAILYETLTGRPPFRGATMLETLEQVRSQEPVPPRQLQPKVPRDLETICLKCLQKDVGRRYASAADVGADLRRFLDDEPILARRESEWIAFGRWCRRNRTLAWTSAVAAGAVGIVIALIAFFVLAPSDSGLTSRLEQEKARANQAAADAEAFRQRLAELENRATHPPSSVPSPDPSSTQTDVQAGFVPLPGKNYIVNSIGMRLVKIPAGKFMMGSSKEEKSGVVDEKQHPVSITQPFYLGVFTVTQEQYENVVGTNPSKFKDVPGLNTRRFPVEQVSWHDAQKFCETLSELPDEKKAGRVYRLPTEAEWEYACRAGTTTPFHFGKVCNGKQANCVGTNPYGTDEKGANLQRPCLVGSYAPNAFGLYDMHGNVWQWCSDRYDAYPNEAVTDPQGAKSGNSRVLRGGSWGYNPWACRAAFRFGSAPGSHFNDFGFRVAVRLD